MAAATISSDLGARENEVCHCSHFLPISTETPVSYEERESESRVGSPHTCWAQDKRAGADDRAG